jgi:hypothetical protein
VKITPKKKKAWLAKALAAGGAWKEVTLLKPVTTRQNYKVIETKHRVGDSVQLDDNDSSSPHGRVVGVGIGAVALAVEAQAVLDWLDAG